MEAGAVEPRSKYSYLTSHVHHSFTPVPLETTGVFRLCYLAFLSKMGHNLCHLERKLSFLQQSLSAKRDNVALELCTTPTTFNVVHFICYCLYILKTSFKITQRGKKLINVNYQLQLERHLACVLIKEKATLSTGNI